MPTALFRHRSTSLARLARWPALAAAPLLAALLWAGAAPAAAQDRPRSHSSLYYRLGGGDPAARASNRNSVAMRLGLGGALRLNYSCGRFDMGASWQNLMNGFANLGTAINGAVQAGIAALPLYVLQRAQPGLYQIFQTYAQKADTLLAATLKSCEEMEAQIRAGGDPYEDWALLAKGEAWKVRANTSGDLIAAKYSVENSDGRAGVTWLGGQAAGGAGQAPIQLVRDLVGAAYNVTMNQAVLADTGTDYVNAAPALAQTRLARSFRRPADAGVYAADVLGELQVALCQQSDCPAKGTSTGLGLGPKLEAEVPAIETALNTLVSAARPDYALLDEIGAPGVAIGREVIDALRELPPFERGIATQRLTREIALARTIDKALVVRNLLLTGLTLPEVTASSTAAGEATKKIATLNRYIDDLLFETRVRKEVVSNTAAALLDAYRGVQQQSTGTGSQRRPDPAALRDGRVQQ